MKTTRILSLLCLTVVGALGAAAETKPMEVYTNDSAEWIPLYGETWWDYYHPDWEGQFPGGRSNRFHEQWVQARWFQNPITKDWQIFDRSYVYDGEWFAVEWNYKATYLSDNFTEHEFTLGVGRIVDGKMILWLEYFDDNVGKLQKLGLMPFPDEGEAVYPWPAKAKISLPYRP
ncbi:hypothetical protein [Actomonas aquatica]|uniref:SnoaL-like domain-containing protein n=1 Tax=Actomonas aquatica TaxID=2866162 RepID=A0ABZ1CB09_9BACT|nr:hypothetical protein [Opitutus sp. WL0086]WRQ88871.1 hypothetical protein K1X11_005600 [Opitutus sp. WL0086]